MSKRAGAVALPRADAGQMDIDRAPIDVAFATAQSVAVQYALDGAANAMRQGRIARSGISYTSGCANKGKSKQCRLIRCGSPSRPDQQTPGRPPATDMPVDLAQ